MHPAVIIQSCICIQDQGLLVGLVCLEMRFAAWIDCCAVTAIVPHVVASSNQAFRDCAQDVKIKSGPAFSL